MSITASPSTVIEHVVLFKIKDNADSSKVNAMFTGLDRLVSLDQVLHLTAGPLVRTRSQLTNFTHMLHSRYYSKEDLSAYSAHPSHLDVVRENALIIDEIMAVDWVAPGFQGLLIPPARSAIRVTFLKLKENVAEEGKNEVLRVINESIGGIIGSIDQITCGENFSPARAKGFSIALLAVFPGLTEMESVDSKEELVNLHRVSDYLEDTIVVDYVVPSAQPAGL